MLARGVSELAFSSQEFLLTRRYIKEALSQGFWIILILQDKTLFNALEAGDIVC